MDNRKVFREGLIDGIPIGIGYFAVSFSLGIAARNAGLNAFQGFLSSFFCIASAGEYALFTSIQTAAALTEIAIMSLVVNARYMLMSFSLSQKFSEKTGVLPRLLIGFAVTDEVFGVSIARKGQFNPYYNYGVITVALATWSLGTFFGVLAGNILPIRIVSALSVALYGMFIAIFIPPARKNAVVAIAILASFALSYICSVAPVVRELSDGTRTIILTLLISSAAAYFRPVREEPQTELQTETK